LVLGGERTEELDGVTLYTSTQGDAAGDLYQGSYDRDGTRKGTFRMTRAGAGRALTTKRTQAQRTQDAFVEAMSLRKLDESQLSQQDRADIRTLIRSQVEARMRSLGADPAQRSTEVTALTQNIEKRLFSEQRTLGELPELVKEAVVAP
jgi:hypothetical protein